MKRSLFFLTGFTLIQAAVHYGIFALLQWEFRPVIALLYVYMLVLSTVFERVLMKEDNAKRFVNYYMAFSGGKLMLSLFILVLYAIFNKEYLLPFAVSFLVVYFSFTTVEIVRLMRHLKNS